MTGAPGTASGPRRPWVFVRPPSDAYERCLRPDTKIKIDLTRARRQHEAYRQALSEFAEVVSLDPEPALPDACFVEDAAVIAAGIAVITRPGAEPRRAEVPTVEKALAKVMECRRMERGRLDGGDVMVAGDVAFVGLSKRTDREGAKELERRLGLEVRTVPIGGWLHLKTAVTPIGPKTLIQYRGAYPKEAFPGFEVLETDEIHGATVLAVGEDVVVSAAAPQTAARLTALGRRVRRVDISEFHAGDAGTTCLSLIRS